MILQLNPTIPVFARGHGEGEAILVIDYGPDVNTVWCVRFPGGAISHFYSDDVRLYGNPMNSATMNKWDIEIPLEWESK